MDNLSPSRKQPADMDKRTARTRSITATTRLKPGERFNTQAHPHAPHRDLSVFNQRISFSAMPLFSSGFRFNSRRARSDQQQLNWRFKACSGDMSEVIMSVRASMALLLFSLLLGPQAQAKNKKKQQLLPDQVLKAKTVLVLIHSEMGEPLTNPRPGRTQGEVEEAIMKWGRFRLVRDTQTADLVIVGVQQSRPPDLTEPGFGGSEASVRQAQDQRTRPRVNETGSSEDIFEVYLGGVGHPLDRTPIWRYTAKQALNGPRVDAVEQFRKAITESEEQRLREK
jgi:hypothetical protein